MPLPTCIKWAVYSAHGGKTNLKSSVLPHSVSHFFFNELTIQFRKLNLKKMEKYHLDKTVMFKLHKNVCSTYKTHTRILWVD